MKCPYCVEEGKKSCVTEQGGSTTCMGWEAYYDEDGKYHNHNPNHHSGGYYCSNGHSWAESYLSRCGNCDYGKDSRSIRKLK